jgi:hypothetical protein
MKNLLIITMLSFILMSCSNNKWTWFAYPYWVSNESTWEIKWWFKSLEECRNWIDNILPNNSVADYECWKNCEFNSTYWMNVCEETVQ